MRMRTGNLLVMATLVSGGWCIKCQVGVNDKTATVDCSGSASEMVGKMKNALGDSWAGVKDAVTGGANGTLDAVKSKFGDLLSGAISGAGNIKEGLNGLTGGRRKREATSGVGDRLHPGELGSRWRRNTEEAKAATNNTSGYVCMKQVKKDGTIMRSCLTKSLASMACKHVGEQGEVCFCEEKDNCNSANNISISFFMVVAHYLLLKVV